MIIQKYIERPLLYNERKFDIRVWALVTDDGNVYYYNKGYMRTSTSKFTMDSTFNFIHLTNNCLQQFDKDYGKYEEGNTLSFEVLQKYLDIMFPQHKVSVNDHIIPRIKDLIIDTILSIKYEGDQKNCFELLGYDFLLDEDFRVWLIEVNENPYLGLPNDYI